MAKDLSARAKDKAGVWHHVIVQILKGGRSDAARAPGRLSSVTAGFPGVWAFGTGAQFDNLRIYAGE